MLFADPQRKGGKKKGLLKPKDPVGVRRDVWTFGVEGVGYRIRRVCVIRPLQDFESLLLLQILIACESAELKRPESAQHSKPFC